MEIDVNATRVMLLSKQYRRRDSGAICTALSARKLLSISRIRNTNFPCGIKDLAKVGCFCWFFMHLFCDSVGQLCIFNICFEPAQKMAARCFLEAGQCEHAHLTPCNMKEFFLNSVQYENLNYWIFYFNANWTGQFLWYMIISDMKSFTCTYNWSRW